MKVRGEVLRRLLTALQQVKRKRARCMSETKELTALSEVELSELVD